MYKVMCSVSYMYMSNVCMFLYSSSLCIAVACALVKHVSVIVTPIEFLNIES